MRAFPRVLISLGYALALTSLGCSDDEAADDAVETPAPEEPATADPAPPPSPTSVPTIGPGLSPDDDPLAGLEDLPDEPSVGALGATIGPAPGVEIDVPARSCAPVLSAQRIWPRPGPPAIINMGERFVVAGYARRGEEQGEEVYVVEVVPDRPPQLLRSQSIEPPRAHPRTAAPGLGPVGGSRVSVAITDGAADLQLGRVPLGRGGAGIAWTPIAGNLDHRFAPAVSQAAHYRVLAWTEASTPMKVRLARVNLEDGIVDSEVLNPTGLGACAPVFLEGVDDLRLIFVDSHVGTSTVLEAALGEEGRPGETRIVRPISNAYEPVTVAGLRLGDHDWFAYTAVGSGAATAIGLVRTGNDAPAPVAVVPSDGYGLLGVDSVVGSSAAVFVASATKGRERTDPREIRLRVLDEGGLGEAITLGGEEGRGWFPSIARREDGLIGVAFTNDHGTWVSWIRCDDT